MQVQRRSPGHAHWPQGQVAFQRSPLSALGLPVVPLAVLGQPLQVLHPSRFSGLVAQDAAGRVS